jgi:hypothetical protein
VFLIHVRKHQKYIPQGAVRGINSFTPHVRAATPNPTPEKNAIACSPNEHFNVVTPGYNINIPVPTGPLGKEKERKRERI